MAVATRSAQFDPVWEELYARGEQLNRYPFDAVVSFVFRYFPQKRKRGEFSILEVGCGAGNNLWFAAREGFNVCGIDASKSAIQAAVRRFEQEELHADLRVGSFDQLPFGEGEFDLAIDRLALTYSPKPVAMEALRELRRVLRPGGKFFCCPYSDAHDGATSTRANEDIVENVELGAGARGRAAFYSREQIEALFLNGWRLLELSHARRELQIPSQFVHAEWQAIVERLPLKRMALKWRYDPRR